MKTVADAISKLQAHLRTQPDDVEALHDLSIMYMRKGLRNEALAAARRVTELAPDLAEGWLNFGNLTALSKDIGAAISAFRKATVLAPQDALAWYNLGNLLAQQRHRLDSIDALEQAHGLAPSNVDILASLALAYRKQNRLQEAITAYKQALALDPDNKRIHSNLLVALQYEPGATDASLFTAHMAWDDKWSAGQSNRLDSYDPDRRPLRVGYVSGDFRRHPIGFFLAGVLANHRDSNVTAICFSDTKSPDTYTDGLRNSATEWIDTRALNEEAFTETVRNTEIDILVDLSGHLNHSRLTSFAKRIAPVQVTWAGYVGTTGLSNMDWLIADRHHAPGGLEQSTSERIIRMPHDYVCYTPPSSSPPVSDLPSDRSGFVTFGSFNNLIKINEDVIKVWASIMHQVDDSRLLLKCADLDQPDRRAAILSGFAERGISDQRLELREQSQHFDLLKTYHEVDIALDPFPYSGGLTTLESLWMGVPVITKTGKSFAGRHSTAHLHTAGLTDWVTATDEAYISLAIEKSRDKSALRNIRRMLRDRLTRSPLCDAARFTHDLEEAYGRMWSFTAVSPDTDRTRVIDIPASD